LARILRSRERAPEKGIGIAKKEFRSAPQARRGLRPFASRDGGACARIRSSLNRFQGRVPDEPNPSTAAPCPGLPRLSKPFPLTLLLRSLRCRSAQSSQPAGFSPRSLTSFVRSASFVVPLPVRLRRRRVVFFGGFPHPRVF